MDKTELRIIAMDYAITVCKPGTAYVVYSSGVQEDVDKVADRILEFLSADEPKEE